jgi:hypothetical protein
VGITRNKQTVLIRAVKAALRANQLTRIPPNACALARGTSEINTYSH